MASLPSMPQPEGFTGIVLPYAAGVKINGPYLGDADYDLSGSRGGKVSTSDEGRTLTGRVLNQSSGLDFQGSRFSVVTFMADGMLEYRSRDDLVFRPYLSTGLSYATINMDALGRAADDAAMMLQFGAGVGIELSPVVTFDARYRYLHPFDRRMRVEGVPVGMDIGTHNLLFGMKISF
ncbi:MAG TPA: outer membrane beta-barrel protein [Chlorobaculum sp.]|nr:outer membrane beta-barrel protein [Chlorobaculum sp.]